MEGKISCWKFVEIREGKGLFWPLEKSFVSSLKPYVFSFQNSSLFKPKRPLKLIFRTNKPH